MGANLKQRVKASIGLAAAIAMGATFGAGQRSAAAEELRIGFLAPFTGGFAQNGEDMKNGFNMYLEEVHSDFAGAKVTIIFEDEQAKPPVAVTKAQKLIDQDKVQFIMGGVLASTGYALAPVSTRNQLAYVMPVSAADDLTQRERTNFPYVVRTGWTGSQTTHALGQWACDQGMKRVGIVAADYAFGYESAGGFQTAFEDCGGKVVQKIWPPLGTKDFGPFLTQIRGDVDAVFTVMVGPMSPQFPAQYAAAGFKKPLIGQGTSADEFSLPFMGDDAIGHVTALQYSAALETPRNTAFVKKYRSLYGKVPSYYSETNYTTAQWIHEVMKKTGGKWPGTKEFVRMMEATQLADTVRGPVRLDDMGSPIQNVYIRRVEKKQMFGFPNAELWNTVIKTYPNTSQFWTYKKDEYLKKPLYSRDFPACKYCE
jgi:branched-chain amino acid transport system substrate-binding protein